MSASQPATQDQATQHQEHPDPSPIVQELARGRSIRCVWRNGIGGTTWQIDQDQVAVEYVKVGPPHPEFDPAADQLRLNWVRTWASAPLVLGHGETSSTTGEPELWLHTLALPGRTAISHDFAIPDQQIIIALGRALRAFHDAGPVTDCPWTWSVADRLSRLPDDHPLHTRPAPPLDPVVAHGDACNPNFLFCDDGQFTGYVDLGRVGVADLWADLAPALLSLGWNFGPGLEPLLLAGYDIDLDQTKLDYYTDLWNSEDPDSNPPSASINAQ